ncbi:hypothetical protein JVU11DRAFT_9 [Chiua virens]|nr:hypothetical protein JVU11DRAFT_9 [Chiua virens]
MVRQTPSRARTLPPSAPLSQQVGGHAGVQVTEDESLLLKPALPHEVSFYQLVRDIVDPSTGLNALKPWIPKFFGLLNIEGKLADPDADNIDAGTVPVIVPVSASEGISASSGNGNSNATPSMNSQTLVLQNLLHGYRKPCVLDVKLGTILYGQDASEEKKARMIKKAAETTTLQTGIRLTGFQVYSNHSLDPIVYGKEYGYKLKPEQLQEGMRHFFPSSISVADLGPSNSNAGLPTNILLTLLTSIHGSLIDLRSSLSCAQLRMVGSSVLIIYEGDWERASAVSGRGGGPNALEEDDVEEEDDSGESDQIDAEIDEQGNIIAEVTADTAFETSSVSTDEDADARLYTVSLIDFAHTRIVPGEGPDPGVLLGMDTLIGLVDQRKQEVAGSIGKSRG